MSKLALATLFASLLPFIQAPSSEAAPKAGNSKRVICHRTKSATNPYRKITVASASVNGNAGHQAHDGTTDGDVWTSSDVSGNLWGDIIPPNDSNAKSQNWTANGQDIYYGRTFVTSTGKPACRGMTLKEFVDAQRAAGVSDADIVADLNGSDAYEDDAILAKNGTGSFTTSNLTTLANSSTSISATTSAASSITLIAPNTAGATLNGSFKTDATSVYYYFEYNTGDPTFALEQDTTSCTALTNTNGTYARSASVTGLARSTKYYFRAVVTDSCSSPTQEFFGEIYSFTTSSTVYRVTYFPSGGTGDVPVDPNVYVSGETAYIYGNTGGLSKAGQVFRNWTTINPGGLRTSSPLIKSGRVIGKNLSTTPEVSLVSRLNGGVAYLKAKIQPQVAFAYGSGDNLTVNNDINLYATYDPAYTVTYNGNTSDGGSAPTDSNNYTSGSSVTVVGNTGTLVKTGYSFDGWCTTQPTAGSACGGTRYVASNTFNISTNTTLYAIWTANTYTISYNANGGSGSMSATTFTFGNSASISNNSFTRSGYTFQNWYTTSTGTGGSSFTGGDSYNSAADLPLYAIWAGNSYVYNGNGNDGGTPPANQTYSGSTLNASSTNITLSGYTFYGWCLTQHAAGVACTGTRYPAGSALPVPSSSTVNLYALWTNVTLYTLQFDEQGGSSVSNQSFASGDSVVLPSAPTRTGYTFAGWFVNSSGGSALGATYDTTGLSANKTLYAQWTINTYTITYFANEGTGSVPNSSSQNYDTEYTVLPASSLSRTGYTFNDWNESSGGGGVARAVNETFTVTANVSLYAQWTPNTYTVNYDANEGGGTTNSTTFTFGNSASISSSGFTRSGYTFAEWNTVSDGTGTSYDPTDSYSAAANLTLYAIWTQNSSGGGGGGGGTPAPLVAPGPTITAISAKQICSIGNDITISGAYFTDGKVTLDGQNVVIKSITSTSILVTLPTASSGNRTIQVTTPNGSTTAIIEYVTVPKPKFEVIRIPYLAQGDGILLPLNATNATSYSLIGQLPTGLSLNPSTGLISGTASENGIFVFTVVASGICGDTNQLIELDIDAPTPNAISHRINFTPNSCEIPDSAKASFERFLETAKGLSPRNIIPDIYVSGGFKNGDPSSATAKCRQDAICDFLLLEDLLGQVLTDVFTGSENRIEIIVYWPRPNDDL